MNDAHCLKCRGPIYLRDNVWVRADSHSDYCPVLTEANTRHVPDWERNVP